VFDAPECSIVRLDVDKQEGTVLVRSTDAEAEQAPLEPEVYPDLLRAYETRDLVFLPPASVVVPLLTQDAVSGVIRIQFKEARQALGEGDERFFRVMALTAANALRNARLFEEMEHRARTDFLTGLPNHRFFQSTLATELIRAQRHNHPLSLMMVDLDYLKTVGHPTGDAVIRAVAETIRSGCRDSDFAARYGGEEFAVILPETPLAGAIQVAERIRDRIGKTFFPGVGHITASIGVSNYPINALGKEDLIRVADQALYVAKNNGRDQVSYFNYQLVTR
jgi:diguanylate cyclase (GGDEF)-like protein